MNDLKLGKYKHFKGGKYELIAVARDCGNPKKKIVVYKALYDSEDFGFGQFWTRPLKEFIGFKEINGKKIKRFEFIEE